MWRPGLLFLLFFPACLLADGFSWSATLGGGGLLRNGNYAYVLFELATSSTGKKGEAIVRCQGRTRIIYRQPFDIHPHSSRRLFVYFQTEMEDITASVEVGGVPVSKPRPLSLRSSHTRKVFLEVGAVTKLERALPSGVFNRPNLARMEWRSLPNDPAGYGSVAWLLLGGFEKAPPLSFGQMRALKAWLKTGGRTLFFLDQHTSSVRGVFKEILDEAGITISGIRTVDKFPELTSEFGLKLAPPPILVPGVRAPARTIRWQEGPLTLSAVAPYGWGKVGVCALATGKVQRLPVNREEFWVFLAGISLRGGPAPFVGNGYQTVGTPFRPDRSFGESIEKLLIPSKSAFPLRTGWIVAFLVCYLTALGPLQRWLIQQQQPFRVFLGVFLSIVAAFSLIAFLLVRWKKGGDTWQREIGLINISEDGTLSGRLFSAIFVPVAQQAVAETPGNVLFSPLVSYTERLVAKRGLRVWDCRMGPERNRARTRFRQWELRSMATSMWSMPSTLRGVTSESDRILASLRDPRIITRQGVFPVSETDRRLGMYRPGKGPGIRYGAFARAASDIYQEKDDFSPEEIGNILLALTIGYPMKVQEINALPALDNGTQVLVGLADYPRLSPQLNLPGIRRDSIVLVRKLIRPKKH